jgi:CxxC-x17-CxxC domain-containing protein
MDEEKSDRQMWKAVCSKCGKDCEVPFEPTEGKPVMCMNCYNPSMKNFQKGKGELIIKGSFVLKQNGKEIDFVFEEDYD